jgi:tetratricopeptide (TPR) repeat protein
VIGKDVPYPLLAAIAEQPEEALRQGLAHLQEVEFLYETRLFPDLEYTFTHTLTHEVTYSGLLQERRRALHARVVDVIEMLHRDRLGEQIERLANHAVRGDLREKAVSYLRQAGLKPAALAANREAVIFFEQAMSALQGLPEDRAATEQAIDLRLDLFPPLLQLGQIDRVLPLSQEAEAIAVKLGDEQRLARVYTYLINYYYLKGEHELAIKYSERCLLIGDATHDIALQALARGYLGFSCHAQGKYHQAESTLKQNIEALESAWALAEGPQAGIFYVLSSSWLAFTLAEVGEFEAARAYLHRAEQAAEASGHVYTQTVACTLAGLVWLRRGRLDRALTLLQKSLDACREKNFDVWRPVSSSLLGLTLVLRGLVEEGLRLLEDGVTLSENLGVRAYLALWTVNLSVGLVAARQLDRAKSVAQRALDLALRHEERGHQAWAVHLLGELSVLSEPAAVGEAEAYFIQALALAEPRGMRPLIAHCHLGLGKLYWRTDKHEHARGHLTTATTMYREMDMTYWLEKAEAEMREL